MTSSDVPVANFQVAAVVAAASTGAPTSAVRGHLWRANWDGAILVVCIVDKQDGYLSRVYPVTFGAADADDSAAVVDEADSPLGVQITFWTELATQIPEITFDRFLGECSHELIDELSANRSANRFRSGLPVLNETSRRAYARRALREQVETIALAATDDPGGEEGLDLPALEWSLAELVALGVPVARALKLARGLAEPTDDEQSKIEQLTGQRPNGASPTLPNALTNTARQLRWSQGVRRIAAQTESTESAAWLRLTRGAYALAARERVTTPEGDWTGRIQAFLESST